MNDITNLEDTIKPKSDQLNADDLLTSSLNVTITGVRRGSCDQPIIIDIAGHMPFKPCKTMRRMLILVWGENGKEWVGRSMTLYNDPTVKWAGVAIGGIRISHVSHITQQQEMMLTATRGKKVKHIILPLIQIDHTEIIEKYRSTPDGDAKTGLWNSLTPEQQQAISIDFNKDK